MILRPILAESLSDLRRLPEYAANDQWLFEQKIDGHRLMVHVDDGKANPVNRAGEPKSTMVTRAILAEFERLTTGCWAFDGEIVGSTFWIFDMPLACDMVEPSTPYITRRQVLDCFFPGWAPNPAIIRLLPYASEHKAKLELAARLLREGCEGLILKDRDFTYVSGKRSRSLLKAKFVHDIDCEVVELRRGGKDNIVVACYDDTGRQIELGEVTALAGDGATIKVGDVVCVKYAYAVDPRRPRLVQPTLPRIRDDKKGEECLLSQIHFTNKGVMT